MFGILSFVSQGIFLTSNDKTGARKITKTAEITMAFAIKMLISSPIDSVKPHIANIITDEAAIVFKMVGYALVKVVEISYLSIYICERYSKKYTEKSTENITETTSEITEMSLKKALVPMFNITDKKVVIAKTTHDILDL